MDATQITAVPDDDLCYAVALGRQTRDSFGLAGAEVRRRGLDCSGEMAMTVSDCSSLSILNPDARPETDPQAPGAPELTTYRVRSTAVQPMRFRVAWDLNLSRLQTIGAGQTVDFPVQVGGARERDISTATPRNAGRAIRPHLQDCTAPRE